MSGFIIWAACCAAGAIAFLVTPLLRPSAGGAPRERVLAAGAGALMLVAAALLYQQWSNWPWRSPPAASGEGIAPLLAATQDHPDDTLAWVNLGRAYLRVGQFPLARRSFEHADHVSSGRSAAALSGLAQVTVFENNGTQTPETTALFERALVLDPHSPQALFYTGVALINAGKLAEARARFAAMRELGPPPQIVDALDKQIAAIDVEIARLRPDPATAIHLVVNVSPALQAKVPQDATLFVFVRSPQGGPPLAVKRLASIFPQQVDLSAADSVLAGNRINPRQRVTVMARISASGTPTASSGDLYGELSAIAGTHGQLQLQIDKRSP
jgi:cytochrome c-type biogenesis protein CcmH